MKKRRKNEKKTREKRKIEEETVFILRGNVNLRKRKLAGKINREINEKCI